MPVLLNISKYLNVSTDYLLGLSNTASFDPEDIALSEVTGLDDKAIDALKEFPKTGNGLFVFQKIISDPRFKEFLEYAGSAYFSSEMATVQAVLDIPEKEQTTSSGVLRNEIIKAVRNKLSMGDIETGSFTLEGTQAFEYMRFKALEVISDITKKAMKNSFT